MKPPDFDIARAHEYLAANCFNLTWDLIEKQVRTADDDEQMILLAHASLWHWTQRPDCTARNMSIGYWQLSRVYALLDRAIMSRHYADRCLAVTPRDDAFCMAYAYEALARAELVAEDQQQSKEHLALAWQHARDVTSDEERAVVVNDLKTLE